MIMLKPPPIKQRGGLTGRKLIFLFSIYLKDVLTRLPTLKASALIELLLHSWAPRQGVMPRSPS